MIDFCCVVLCILFWLLLCAGNYCADSVIHATEQQKYSDNCQASSDYANNSVCTIDLPVNKRLHENTTTDISGITTFVSAHTTEDGRNNTLYVRVETHANPSLGSVDDRARPEHKLCYYYF